MEKQTNETALKRSTKLKIDGYLSDYEKADGFYYISPSDKNTYKFYKDSGGKLSRQAFSTLFSIISSRIVYYMVNFGWKAVFPRSFGVLLNTKGRYYNFGKRRGIPKRYMTSFSSTFMKEVHRIYLRKYRNIKEKDFGA